MRTNNYLLYLFVFASFIIYACRETEDIPMNEPPIPEAPELPAELSGDWLDFWSLSMQYHFDSLLFNPVTKVWFRGSYDPWSMNPVPGFGIRFLPNGSFTWAVVTSTSTGGCHVYTTEYVKGTVQTDGRKLTFVPQVRRMKYHSVCNPANNFDRDENKTGFTLSYTISTASNNAGQTFDVLTLINPDGSQIKYLRIKN